MKDEQHEYYGDNLSQFVDNGGKVIMLGWAPYKDGIINVFLIISFSLLFK